MIGRIVEIADDRRHLSLARGFMVVEATDANSEGPARIPLDDIAAVIAHAHGLSYTNGLLVALAERGAPVVLCGTNHNAVGMVLPVEGNWEQARRFDAQLAASKPLRKQLWAELVRAKLRQQAAALEAIGASGTALRAFATKVRSGDPANVEAQGARRYWGQLFGPAFRRDREAGGTNGLLNYGYTVLRAATARAVVAAGLHPTLGLHHQNEGNTMRLVDDLMEPFRPLIDVQVWRLGGTGTREVDSTAKRALVRTLYEDMETGAGATPVMACLQKLAVSLAQVFLGERKKLDLPLPGLSARPEAAAAEED